VDGSKKWFMVWLLAVGFFVFVFTWFVELSVYGASCVLTASVFVGKEEKDQSGTALYLWFQFAKVRARKFQMPNFRNSWLHLTEISATHPCAEDKSCSAQQLATRKPRVP